MLQDARGHGRGLEHGEESPSGRRTVDRPRTSSAQARRIRLAQRQPRRAPARARVDGSGSDAAAGLEAAGGGGTRGPISRRHAARGASPRCFKGVLYMVNDNGIVTTFNPETGAVIKRGRLTGARSRIRVADRRGRQQSSSP